MKWATTSARLAGGRSEKTPNCSKLCSRTKFLVNTLNLYRDDCPAWNFFRLICKGWNYAKHRLETVTARWAFAPEKVHNHKKAENYGKSCVCLFSLHFELNECSHMCRKCLDTLFAPAYQQASQHLLPGVAASMKQRGGEAFINYRWDDYGCYVWRIWDEMWYCN